MFVAQLIAEEAFKEKGVKILIVKYLPKQFLFLDFICNVSKHVLLVIIFSDRLKKRQFEENNDFRFEKVFLNE